MKCTINGNNEITSFWEDESAPENAVDCDKLPDDKIHATGLPIDQTLLYKLVSGTVTPTEAGIAYLAQEYARNRASAFPSIGDQLDMQYHDQLDGTTTWKDAVAKVKSDNPKPE